MITEKCSRYKNYQQIYTDVSKEDSKVGCAFIQSKLFITSLVITEYSISDIKMLGTDLFPLKFPLYTEYSLNDTDSNFWEHIHIFY